MLSINKAWIYFAIVVGLVGIGAYFMSEYQSSKRKLLEAGAKQAMAAASASNEARIIEQAVTTNDFAISDAYQKGLINGKANLDNAIAELDRLRKYQKLSRNNLPKITADSCRSDAEKKDEQLGRLHEDLARAVEEQYRLSQEADNSVKQLNGLIDAVKTRTGK